MPSFDIVSEINKVELKHSVENAARELSTRFDFRGSEASIEQDDFTITMKADSDFQVRQLEEIFRNHCARRSISCLGAEVEDKPVHSGKTFILTMKFKEGIEQDDAKEIVKLIKENKLKVQASIQGDKIRVNGKKRDDLQETIAFLKKANLDLELQFENFRD